MTEAIERISVADRAAFERFERESKPVVIAGGASELRATKRWTASYLEAAIGNVEVRYKLSSRNSHPDFHASGIAEMFAVGTSSFSELLRALTTGPREERSRRLFTGDEQFLMRCRNGITTRSSDLAPLLDDIDIPAWVPTDRLYTAWAWFSGPGVRTWLHYDNNGCHNFNAQITGQKQCWLFAPEHLAQLAPFPFGGKNPAHNCSAIDVDDPSASRALADIPRLEATLEAGDLLFIPAWYFHTFFHLGELNSNVNFWWKPALPIANRVADRQRLIDLAIATGVDPRSADPAAALLRRLDELAIAS